MTGQVRPATVPRGLSKRERLNRDRTSRWLLALPVAVGLPHPSGARRWRGAMADGTKDATAAVRAQAACSLAPSQAGATTERQTLSTRLPLRAHARSHDASSREAAVSRRAAPRNVPAALLSMSVALPWLQAAGSLNAARLCGAQTVRFEASLRRRSGGARAPRLFVAPRHTGSCGAARIHTSSSSTAFELSARSRAHL
jgi:hypothetical protein